MSPLAVICYAALAVKAKNAVLVVAVIGRQDCLATTLNVVGGTLWLAEAISNKMSTDKVIDWILHLHPNIFVERLRDTIEIGNISTEISPSEE